MKSALIFFIALFALGKTQANDECSEERVGERSDTCLENLFSTLLTGDPSESEVCQELETLTTCLETIIDECLNDEQKEEIDQELQDLKELLGENCPNTGAKAEAEKCAEDNKEYLMECLTENELNAIMQTAGNLDENSNVFKCTVYSLIADCVTERMEEKCGETARDLIREELNGPPQEIKDACDAADEVEITDFESLLKRKKK